MLSPIPLPYRRRILAWLGCALAGLGAAACSEAPPADPRPAVVVSVPPHGWLVDRLAGEHVRSTVMLPPAANPASHQPSLGQLRAIEAAALYIRVGHPHFPFERAWFDSLTQERDDLRTIDLSAPGAARDDDPHEWLDPKRMRAGAQRVAEALEALVPAASREIDANLERLVADIDALDRDIAAALQPVAGRPFFVFHPAWGYFAEAYGLEQVAIERQGKAPGVRDLERLIARARSEQARVVFVEPQFDDAAARTVAAEIGARVEILDPLAYDWDTNLRRSARAIAEALQP